MSIDELGANILFQLINKRYEKNSTIITTNKLFSKLGEVFVEPIIASTILDRLLHHSFAFSINDKSYRTKDILELYSGVNIKNHYLHSTHISPLKIL